MKITFNQLLIVTIVATLLGGAVMYGNKALSFAASVSKVQMYEKHLQPEMNAYYSVESINKERTFVIGYLVKPEIGGKVSKKGELTTIEVPVAKGTGLMKGAYLTVMADQNGIETIKYFLDQSSVVQHALDN